MSIGKKSAHTEDDVLGNSYKLKARFPHTVLSKTMLRMQADFLSRIDEVAGLNVLDVGCGHAQLSLSLLTKGARHVAGIDISDVYVKDAAAAAEAMGSPRTSYDFRVMDAHALTYEDNFFDIVVGNGILHHLDLPICLGELKRVLKPGGYALFIEPLAGHPLLRLFRLLMPRARTLDEKPLTASDLRKIGQTWTVVSRYYGIISAPITVLRALLLRPFPKNPLLSLADLLERLLSGMGVLNAYNQCVMLVLIEKTK